MPIDRWREEALEAALAVRLEPPPKGAGTDLAGGRHLGDGRPRDAPVLEERAKDLKPCPSHLQHRDWNPGNPFIWPGLRAGLWRRLDHHLPVLERVHQIGDRQREDVVVRQPLGHDRRGALGADDAPAHPVPAKTKPRSQRTACISASRLGEVDRGTAF
jgi:hypothetical protein